jgi:hypothetical protein
LTSLVSRETFLEAVFLWIIPLPAALHIAEIALLRAAFAPSTFLFTTSNSTFFESVLSMLLTLRFLSALILPCLALLICDLLFFGAIFAGKELPSFYVYPAKSKRLSLK